MPLDNRTSITGEDMLPEKHRQDTCVSAGRACQGRNNAAENPGQERVRCAAQQNLGGDYFEK